MLFTLKAAEEQEAWGEVLANSLQGHEVILFKGDLGAGKTTLCRGILRGLGYQGRVKSPTYTLIEPYEVDGLRVFHYDLYRLGDAEELDYLGVRDYCAEPAIHLIEWPEKGAGYLPAADLTMDIRVVEEGRCVHLHSHSDAGETVKVKMSGGC